MFTFGSECDGGLADLETFPDAAVVVGSGPYQHSLNLPWITPLPGHGIGLSLSLEVGRGGPLKLLHLRNFKTRFRSVDGWVDSVSGIVVEWV